MYCPDCGKQTPAGRRFCMHCGLNVEDALTPSGEEALHPQFNASTPSSTIGDHATRLSRTGATSRAAGNVIAGRYEVLAQLGQGGMGVVYRVHDRILNAECALKAMHSHLLSSDKTVQRFIREVRLSLELQHPGIVRVRDIGHEGDLRFLTMELLDGQTLREWLRQLDGAKRRAPVSVVVSIVSQVLSALDYAHRTTIHRDIKPENIFLLNVEPDFEVKLLDLGIAKTIDREPLTSTNMSMGTVWYMAPEQRKGAADVDARADLYSLGVVLYELLTGDIPRAGSPPPSRKRAELSEAWDRLVLDAMEEHPERRPQNASTMLRQLRELTEDRAQKPAEESQVELSAAEWGSGSEGGERRTLNVGGQKLVFVWIPPGESMIGSLPSEPGRGDDEIQWKAEFSGGLWMQATEVTQEQWQSVMDDDRSRFRGSDRCPVENVSWNDAHLFIAKLNAEVSGGGFRLPTEAEWEYSARAGSDGTFGMPCPDYKESSCTGKVHGLEIFAWYDTNSDGRTHPVGEKIASPWGLHDVHGNVWEWCEDWYGEYPSGSHTDWKGPAHGRDRVLRGGSWNSFAWLVRAAQRHRYDPDGRDGRNGFRCVRDVL